MKPMYYILAFLLFFHSCSNQNNKKETFSFFVGTYTNGESEGIYKYQLSEDGSMKNLGLMTKAENPSYLAKSVTGDYLVVVNETSDKNQEGSVESYEILEDSLMLIDRKSSRGAHPCQLSINSDGYLAVANYSGGNVGLLKLDEQGQLTNVDVQQHFGQGTDSIRQEGPHAHSVYFYPQQHQLISADLGTNELWFSEIDFESQKLKKTHENLKMKAGAGPRHICFHPNQKWLYVINEMHGSITQIERMEEGNYQTRSTVSTLRSDFQGDNFSADIHISSDGRFVYATNRGPNEIVVFKVDTQNGQLSLLSHQSTHGNWPRNFSLSPDEEFLLVAHQYSNNITCFKRDKETGLLSFVSEVDAPNPVCLLF